MALIATWNAAGDGIVVSRDINNRQYSIEEDGVITTLRETTTVEERLWKGLTQAAAIQAVNEAPQPAQNGATWSYIARVENQAIRSFEVRRIYELKTTVPI